MQRERIRIISRILETIYQKYHKPEFIHPDPLELVLRYPAPEDQEIAGLVAASFATGRVGSILKTVRSILAPFPSLKKDLLATDRAALNLLFKDFKYRFYPSASLVDFLEGIKKTVLYFGSLENCFLSGSSGKNAAPYPLLSGLVSLVRSIGKETGTTRSVLPDPEKGSAVKRLNMYARWMIRCDEIDPGTWKTLSPEILIIPLDTHIMQISHILRLTRRQQADMKTALEITEALRAFDKTDPVRFDFSLSRLGIHPDLSYEELYRIKT